MKTIKEYLEELPEPVRTRALSNLNYEAADEEATDIIDAIASAFAWDSSPEGFSYWSAVYDNPQEPPPQAIKGGDSQLGLAGEDTSLKILPEHITSIHFDTLEDAVRALFKAQGVELTIGKYCKMCDGSGAVDSGGVTPWGQGIDVECPECKNRECQTPITHSAKRKINGYADEWVPCYVAEELERKITKALEQRDKLVSAILSEIDKSYNDHD